MSGVAELLGLLQAPGEDPVPHEYVKAQLGHSNHMCKWCSGTPNENAVLSPNHCVKRKHNDPRYAKPVPA